VVGRAGSRRVGVDGKEVAVLFPYERERDGSRWHESSGGESSPRENSRIGVGRPPDVGLPNCRNAWPGAGNQVGERPGENWGIVPPGFLFTKGALILILSVSKMCYRKFFFQL
jgi:hypothetical protein